MRVDGYTCVVKPLAAGMLMTLVITVAIGFAKDVFSGTLGTLVLIALCAIVYLSALWLLKVFDKSEIALLGKRNKANLPAQNVGE